MIGRNQIKKRALRSASSRAKRTLLTLNNSMVDQATPSYHCSKGVLGSYLWALCYSIWSSCRTLQQRLQRVQSLPQAHWTTDRARRGDSWGHAADLSFHTGLFSFITRCLWPLSILSTGSMRSNIHNTGTCKNLMWQKCGSGFRQEEFWASVGEFWARKPGVLGSQGFTLEVLAVSGPGRPLANLRNEGPNPPGNQTKRPHYHDKICLKTLCIR